MREKAAQVGRQQTGEIGDIGRGAEALVQEGQKLPDVAPIRLQRLAREPPLVAQRREPGDDAGGEFRRGREGEGVGRRHRPSLHAEG